VIFRHGARTPLTAKHWEGTSWDVCGTTLLKAPIRVTDHTTGSIQQTCIDNEPIKYQGGCLRGELTLLGQAQVRNIDSVAYFPESFVLSPEVTVNALNFVQVAPPSDAPYKYAHFSLMW
jgi:hypothetical protein